LGHAHTPSFTGKEKKKKKKIGERARGEGGEENGPTLAAGCHRSEPSRVKNNRRGGGTYGKDERVWLKMLVSLGEIYAPGWRKEAFVEPQEKREKGGGEY